MKFALCNEVIADRPFAEQCALAAGLGYDGLEIAPYTLADDPRQFSDKDIQRVQRDLADAGIVATGLHWLLVKPAGLSIISPDGEIRRNTLEVLTACIDLCAELGGAVLVHGSPKQRSIGEDDDRAEAEARALDIFQHLASRAEAAGVTYCLEPLRAVMTNYVTTIAEAVHVVEQVGSPAFKTMIDTSAAAASEPISVAATIRQWMPSGHLAHVQFNDTNRRAAGQGDDRFADILKALRDTQYDGIVAMEPFIYEPSPEACAAFTIGYVKGLSETL